MNELIPAIADLIRPTQPIAAAELLAAPAEEHARRLDWIHNSMHFRPGWEALRSGTEGHTTFERLMGWI
jgi:hypothetical protein